MKPTVLEKEKALSVVRMLFSYGFKKALGYDSDYVDFYDWRRCDENIEMMYKHGIEVTCGASKVCIILDDEWDFEWVIKIGFNRRIDYCALEARYYAKAVEMNCASHLAETYLCGVVDGIEVFLQEKVETEEELFEERIWEYVAENYDENNYPDEDERNDNIAEYVENECSSEDYIMAILGNTPDSRRLLDFVDENDINDLHELNWGVTADDRIVLIDFSGY